MRRLSILLACLLPIAGLLSLAGPADAVGPVLQAKPAAVRPSTATNPAGGYHPITAVRVFNTASTGALTTGVVRKVSVGGNGGIPADSPAVEVNVTVRGPAKSGSIAVFPGTSSYNGSATISFTAGVTEQRMIIGNLGSDGTLALRNNVTGTSLQVILDVVGYWVGGAATQPGAYHPIAMARVANPAKTGLIPASGTLDVVAGGQGAIPVSTDGLAIAVNVTVQAPKKAGSVAVYLGGFPTDAASPVTFAAGATVQKMVIIGLNRFAYDFDLVNSSSAPVSVVADVVGYFDTGSRESIGGFNLTSSDSKGSLVVAAGTTAPIPVLPSTGVNDSAGLPVAGVWAVKLDVRVTQPTAAGSISVFSGDEVYAGVATASFRAGEVGAYEVTSRVSPDGRISIRNNAGVSVQVSVNVTAYFAYRPNPLGFSNETTAFSPRTAFTSVSCASATFCAGVEGLGRAAIFSGRSWSPPIQIPGQTSGTDVACPAVNECFAVGGSQIASYDGTSWTPSFINAPIYSAPRISCANASSCVATFGQRYATWDGTSWTLAAGIATGSTGFITSLSCTSSTFCVGIDNSIYYVIFDGTTWTAPARLAGGTLDMTQALSCSTAQFCELVTNTGLTSTFDGTTWSAETKPVGVSSYFKQLSCVSASYCVAVDRDGASRTFNGTSWSDRLSMGGAGVPLDVSCVAVGQCLAVTWLNSGVPYPNGDYYAAYSVSFNGTSWSPRSGLAPGFGAMTGLSCPTTTFCAAVTAGGAAAEFNGTTWTPAVSIDDKGGLSDVSCASGSLCVAIGANGVAAYQSGSWSGPTDIDPGQTIDAVSCSPTGVCVIGDEHGQVLVYSGGNWAPPVSLGSVPIQQVSCSADGTCIALQSDGGAALYRNGSWQALPASPIAAATALSCTSSSYCLASRFGGGSAAWNGTAWSAVPDGYAAISCVGALQCEGINTDGDLIAWDGQYRSSYTTIGNTFGRVRVSCPSSSSCFISDGNRTVINVSVGQSA